MSEGKKAVDPEKVAKWVKGAGKEGQESRVFPQSVENFNLTLKEVKKPTKQEEFDELSRQMEEGEGAEGVERSDEEASTDAEEFPF